MSDLENFIKLTGMARDIEESNFYRKEFSS